MAVTNPELSILEDLGLSMNEGKVYLTLLEVGTSSAGRIAQKSGIHRTNVYDALQKLVEKGLAMYFNKAEKKVFTAADPSHLSMLIKDKEMKLAQLMPKLSLLKDLEKHQGRSVTIAEGMVAARNSLQNSLAWKEPIYTIGSSEGASSASSAFITQFHKRRIGLGIPMIHIFNSDSRERAKKVKRMSLTDARVLPKDFNANISTNICGEEVVFKIWGADAIIITIRCKELADAYRAYHKLLWELSLEP